MITKFLYRLLPAIPYTGSFASKLSNRIKGVKDMPGPRPILPFVGTNYITWPFGEFYGDDTITTKLEKMAEKYGPIYREKVNGTWIVHLHGSDNIKKVLHKQGKFPWRPINEAMADFRRSDCNYASAGTNDLNGAEWFDYRNKFASLISRRPSAQLVEGLSNIAQEFVDVIDSKKDKETNVVDILDPLFTYGTETTWLLLYGHRISAMTGMSFDPTFAACRSPVELFASFGDVMNSSLWKYISTPSYKRMIAAEKAALRVHQEAVHRYSDHKGNDLRDKSLLQKFIDNGKLAQKEIISLSMDSTTSGTFVFGIVCSILLHKLAQEPLAYLKLQKEVDDILDCPTDDITLDKLNRMSYIKACFKEGTRMASPISYMLRILPEAIDLEGYNVPAGTPIICHSFAPSKVETNFRWADKFIPERWILPDSSLSGPQFADLYAQGKTNSMLVLPFGFGWRSCLGRSFAQANTEILLAKLIRNFHITSNGKLRLGNKFLVGPLDNVNITLTRRTS